MIYFNGKYINDLREGYWEFYRDNNILISKGNYIKGKKVGYWEWYNSNGTLYQTKFYAR
jgi:antitoxin component YwqK of YwqJK toxin-antitoxin module